MNKKIIEQINSHNKILKDYATKDQDAIYLKEVNDDIRPAFFHDIDRIIYALSFMRYQDKTQVFARSMHAHVSKRMIHVQFVSKIARTIGRALGLNEDLIEAASLGHDLGHTPFGHVGESILNKISLKHNAGYFNHNIESVRVLKNIENYGKGLNVSVQVLDAIMCHNGEILEGKYEPIKKDSQVFLAEYEACYEDKTKLLKLKPMTLEGCVVRISDLIAYIGRDIDDAIRYNIIKREDIPENITRDLGRTTREIVNTCILDVINNSFDKNYIKLSDNVFKAINDLKNFNYQSIYNNSLSKDEKETLQKQFEKLFDTYLEDININNEASPIICSYLNNMSEEYKNNTDRVRIVIDYIAGMTDSFLIKEYERIMGDKS